MTRFVLDCSVSAAWCLKDESSRKADRYLDLLSGGEAVVPGLWVVEMANVLATAERRRRITPDDVRLAMDLITQLPIAVEPVARDYLPGIHRLAVRHDLAAYDACYLDLAMRLELPMATLDEKLKRAARRDSVAVC